MNKIFSLKYSNISGGYIAVAEICRGAKKSGRQKRSLGGTLLLFLGAWLSVSPGIASVVSDEIPYSVFRDFAENKGVFQPGAENIKIYNKVGELVGVLDKAPFPDFSSASASSGIATLVAPQYIVSVAHNGGYSAVSFGASSDGSNNYSLVDRNVYSGGDFHIPRLNKIVTEVAPIPMTTAGTGQDTYKNTTRFPIFYRVGSGTQYTKTRSGELRYLQGAYSYVTGGTIGVPLISDHSIVTNPGNIFDPVNGPLASYGTPGDSGSPLYAYDAQEGRWVLVAVLRAYNGDSGATNWWVVLPPDFIREEMAKDSDPAVTFKTDQGALQWTYDSGANRGSLSQSQSGAQFTMHGQAGNDLNAGKNLVFQTDGPGTRGEILLKSHINQGAGVLTFDADYRISAQNGQTWQGAGVIVNPDKQVDWQLNGVAGDNLHRLGTGTLHVNGVGVNPGGLKVGDGLTLLDQRPDAAGKVRAFSSLNIASGRPTVKLMAERQIDPDSVTWGFRGGQLDVNGHDLTFHRLNMADAGAVLTNSASEAATVTLALNGTALVHGQFRGKLDLVAQISPSNARLIVDGGIDIDGNVSASGGHLQFQGHPVIHARDYSTGSPPVSTTQPDWEDRLFRLKTLTLTQSIFSLARNATLRGDIQANASHILFNDSRVFVDNKDGEGVATEIKGGQSPAPAPARSRYHGNIHLTNDSKLDSSALTQGDISADNSDISLLSSAEHQGNIALSADASLALWGTSQGSITADGSRVSLARNSVQGGDITLRNASTLKVQNANASAVTAYGSQVTLMEGGANQGRIDLHDGSTLDIQRRNHGAVTADHSQITLGEQANNQGEIALRNDAVLLSDGSTTNAIAADNSVIVLRHGGVHQGTMTLSNDATLWSQAEASRGAISADASRVIVGAGGSQSGNITLTNGADLIHRGALLAGEITASDSQVLLDSGSVHVGATTQLTDNATLTVKGESRADAILADNSHIVLSRGGQLKDQGTLALKNGSTLALENQDSSVITAAASQITLAAGSEHTAAIALSDRASLDIQGQNRGVINANNSQVTLSDAGQHRGAINLAEHAALTLQMSLDAIAPRTTVRALAARPPQVDGDIDLRGASTLNSMGQSKGTMTAAGGSVLNLGAQSAHQGDITLSDSAQLNAGGRTEGTLSADASRVTLQAGGQHTGAVALNRGATLTIQAPAPAPEAIAISADGREAMQLQGEVTLTAASSLISAGSIDGAVSASESALYLLPGSLHRGGDIALSDGATLALAGRNQSAILAEASLLTLGRSAAQRGDIALSQGARLVSEGRSQGRVSLSDSEAYFGPASQHRGDLFLQGDDAHLAVLPGASLQGDLSVDGASLLRFGVPPAPEIAAAAPLAVGPVDYRGRIAAPQAHAEMRDTLWRVNGDSTLGSLRAEASLITATDGAFMTLSVDRLHADGVALALRADAEASDRLVINERLSGGHNTVLVNYLEPTLPEAPLNLSLISAPAGSDRETFTARRQHMGFSEVMPALVTREADRQLDWVLIGFDVAPDSEREEDAASLLALNYRSFMAEVQYLDKRQLDLRNDPTDSGVWARVLHGAGSAAENYRDRYLHLQVGADRRYGLGETGDLFAGATATFTDGRASGDAFSSKSRALGAGLYATALFPSGLFVDLNGKYVHHSTEYQVSLAGLGERKATNHAWYARADVGYRYGLSESAFVEPHLEMVYGTYSSTRFDWRDQGMAVSLAQPRFTPLLATAGVALGKQFTLGEWQTTLRAGVDYQRELIWGGIRCCVTPAASGRSAASATLGCAIAWGLRVG
ncbi:S6 family peptidase [Edwardsiella piscicida]|uniref:S6 family peptidase n=1 Tax=Edwardsiella piscicida TaxID=1263550 RepID=UPI00370D6A9F